jgi:hypothetical protein
LPTGGYPVFPAPFVEGAIFSPTYVLDFFVKNQMAVAAWVCVWVFYSVPLVFMSVFVLFLLLWLYSIV